MDTIFIQGNRVSDLSQTIEAGLPVPPGFPGPEFETFLSRAHGDVANVQSVRFGVRTATHCDGAYHFFSELLHVVELPPDCLVGAAVVVDLNHHSGSTAIRLDDIRNWVQNSGERIDPDDIGLLHTRHSRRWHGGSGASAYGAEGWLVLSPEVIDFLASLPIRAVGVETCDPDWVNPADLATASFPTQCTLLPRGIYIIENLTYQEAIEQAWCHIIAMPLKLKGCSGSPIRMIAVA